MSSTKIDEEVKMQPRKIRFKNAAYLAMFGVWYTGIVLFIMYRLRSDDLELLEIEAEERIKISKLGKPDNSARRYDSR